MSRDTSYVSRVNRTTKRSLLGCGFIIVSIYLATNAFVASRYVDRDKPDYLASNLYLSSRALQDTRLAAAINRESKSLEFMVWSYERRELSRELSEMLYQRINFDPLNGNLWSQLSYLQKDAGIGFSTRAWTIERATRTLRWNFHQRSKMSHYCITEYASFQKVSPDLCSSLLSNLPVIWNDDTIARHANVKVSDLRAVKQLEQAKAESGGAR